MRAMSKMEAWLPLQAFRPGLIWHYGLTVRIHMPEFARTVRRAMEYDPAPPYAAQVFEVD